MRIHLVKTAAGSSRSWVLPVFCSIDAVQLFGFFKMSELTYHSVIELTLRHLMHSRDCGSAVHLPFPCVFDVTFFRCSIKFTLCVVLMYYIECSDFLQHGGRPAGVARYLVAEMSCN